MNKLIEKIKSIITVDRFFIVSKVIKVSCCADCPFNMQCKAWKKLSSKQRVYLAISHSVPHDMILKDCHLEDEIELATEDL